jgi:hypothetical protein
VNLFSRIPGNFFSPLSSPNREIYFDALMLLKEKLEHELTIRVEDYISSLVAMLEDREFIIGDEEEDAVKSEAGLSDGRGWQNGFALNDKARIILARLVRAGWIDREKQEGAFYDIITPRDYSIRIMQVLDEICNEDVREYNSLVYATYASLRNAAAMKNDEPGFARDSYNAVMAARSNTERLMLELRSLFHNIRSYIMKIPEQNNINELLENHFEKYKPMADRVYHPIKTLDSVHRYMAPIPESLQKIRDNDKLLAAMRGRAMKVRRYETEDEAGEEILSAIDYVLDSYGSLGNIIDEIDRKHIKYTKESTDKMTYMMSADGTIKGKLIDIMQAYASAPKEKKKEMLSFLSKNIRVLRQNFLDGSSVFHRNVVSRRIAGETLSVVRDKILTEEDIERIAATLKNFYSPEDICRFVAKFFAEGKNEASSSELPINDDTDFILLILAVARQGERKMNYTVEVLNGKVLCRGYTIPEMVFRRKVQGV